MKTQGVWLSFDLGVKGDYPGLYKFLDTNKAKECGNSVAYFQFNYQTDLVKELTEEIKKNVELKNSDRLYIIFKTNNDKGELKAAGKYIIGNRRASPWQGYAPSDEDKLDI